MKKDKRFTTEELEKIKVDQIIVNENYSDLLKGLERAHRKGKTNMADREVNRLESEARKLCNRLYDLNDELFRIRDRENS